MEISMTRSKQREQAFHLIFEMMFSGAEASEYVELYGDSMDADVGAYAVELYQGVCAHLEAIDETIASYLNGWKINRIAKVNLAILRLAVYEICFDEELPDSVAINEAVELAKTYGSSEDGAFVNGVLGSVVRGKA